MSRAMLHATPLAWLLTWMLLAPVAWGQGGIPLPGGAFEGEQADAGPTFDLSGYIEDTFSVERIRADERTITINSTRFRLDLEADLGHGLDVGATLISFVNTGTRSVDLVKYLPPSERGLVAPFTRPAFFYSFKANDTFFQEAFLGYQRPGLLLRAGRQKIYSGTGYAYNPIDLFNRKDPLDPTYEIDGIDAALIELQLPGGSAIEAIVRRDDDHDTEDVQLRYEAHLSGWDMALQATHHSRWRVDYETLAAGLPLESYERRFIWNMIATEVAGEIGGVGLHGEAGYVSVNAPSDVGTLDEAGEDHLRLLVGADYTFESQLYVIAEYLHLGQGRVGTRELTLNDRFAYLAGEVLAPNRDTLFAGATYPITDLTDLSLFAIIDLGTPSALLNPWLVWNAMPALTVSLSATIPVGDRAGTNGESGPAGFIRARYSF